LNTTNWTASCTWSKKGEVTGWRTTGVNTLFNEGSGWDDSTGRFTAPVTGYYAASAQLRFDDVGSGCSRLVIAVDGTWDINNGLHAVDSSLDSYYTMNVAGTLYLTAGQYISVWAQSASDPSWYVQSESGFSVHYIEASLTSSADATSTSSSDSGFTADLTTENSYSSMGTGTQQEVTGWTTTGVNTLFNEGSAWSDSTGRFTAPATGYYAASAQIRFDGVGSGYSRLVIAVDGTYDINNGLHAIDSSLTSYYTVNVAGTLYLTAGQYISVWAYSQSDSSWAVQSESGFSVHYIV